MEVSGAARLSPFSTPVSRASTKPQSVAYLPELREGLGPHVCSAGVACRPALPETKSFICFKFLCQELEGFESKQMKDSMKNLDVKSLDGGSIFSMHISREVFLS
ncbi:hypothetical protein FOZ62_029888 [Perkinsus olseni]|uniref:Uncharacterized protein n=1 Tax=Perkinsus olseni TaxID=32597 RepID=A0A7J6R6Q6_PEROL|nr:hypothetical protein FOZ62_029888 [Perkinsus olseni]